MPRSVPMAEPSAPLVARFDCLRRTDALLVSAHRAVWDAGTPDNSLAAIRRTGREIPGVMLELDVALTADGALVLMRDDDLDRTTDATDTPAAVRQGSPEARATASACLAG
ncbi:MAG: glycerophosphodiester phosphodiesterase family protein [Brevundimonas sp.]